MSTALVVGLMAVTAVTGQRQNEMVLEQTFNVQPGGTLDVNLPDGDVEVTTHNGAGASVQVWLNARDLEWGREVFARMSFSAEADGNDLVVTARPARVSRREWRRNHGVGVRVILSVPSRYNAEIETDDGDVSLQDLSGEVTLVSSDGDITLGSVRGTGINVRTADGDIVAGDVSGEEVELRTSDGDIRAANVAAASVDIDTSDGDIRVRRASGSVNVETNDGDVVVGLGDVEGVAVSSGDGDVVIYAPEGLSADINLRGEDINLDRDVTVQGRVTRRQIEGQLNGGGPTVTVRASDGSITFRSGTPRTSR